MHPSKKWIGHWNQNGLGRQDMHDLFIEFQDNRLTGTGWDCVGNFTLTGEIQPNANVQFVKKYASRHSIVYIGQHDGEGMIYGRWFLDSDEGTFALRHAGGPTNSQATIKEFRP